MADYSLVTFDFTQAPTSMEFPLDSDISKMKVDTLLGNMKKGEFRSKAKDYTNIMKNVLTHVNSRKIYLDSKETILFFEQSFSRYKLNMYMSLSNPSTFKFFGMDVTEDLDVVIKTHSGTVLVGNLVKEFQKQLDITMDSDALSYLPNINSDNIKEMIVNFKLGNFSTKNTTDILEIFTDVVVEGSSTSIIRNFLNDMLLANKDITGSGGVQGKEGVFLSIYTALRDISQNNTIMKEVLSLSDLYLELSTGVNGESGMKSYYDSVLVTDLPISGNVFKRGDSSNILDTVIELSVANTYLLETTAKLKNMSVSSTFEVEDILCTMAHYGSDIDVYEMTDKDFLAGSVLDLMAYKDEDLIIRGFDFNSDDKDVLITNILKTYKQKFRDFYDEDVADALIELTGGDNTENILNVKSGYDIYITDKSSLINSGKLIDKLSRRVMKLFK